MNAVKRSERLPSHPMCVAVGLSKLSPLDELLAMEVGMTIFWGLLRFSERMEGSGFVECHATAVFALRRFCVNRRTNSLDEK